ncbi:T9SS type A sorting domain-containing protein [Flammeovirga sp. SubArs3]|uniref:DUF7619 domain-containing protein n=1 Tax=Flammeovirga sp. SubArs3 TaxID=2995316 RepID=UPI00248B748E|nr:T9SS type A sorting domain-containing protein [Flammeovirga sp. SubArs3]
MKKLFTLLFIIQTHLLFSQDINIPDENFLHSVIAQGYDINGDSIIQETEALAVTKLNLYQKGIDDFTGLTSFTNLTWLDISHNYTHKAPGFPMDFTMMENLTYLDASVNNFNAVNVVGLTHLDTLDIEQLNLNTFDFTGLEGLKYLDIHFNNFSTIDLSILTSLEYLAIHYNNLSTLDATPCKNLKWLAVGSNPLLSIDVTGLTELETLYLTKVDISELDLSTQTNLERLSLSYTNLPSDYTFDALPSIEYISIAHNGFENIDVSHLSTLEELSLPYNSVDSLNISGLEKLERLSCAFNEMDTLVLEGCKSLNNIRAWENNLRNLDLSDLNNLQYLFVSDNELTDIDVSNLDSLLSINAHGNMISELDLSNNPLITYLSLQENDLTSLDISHLDSLTTLYVQDNNNMTCLSRLPDKLKVLDINNTDIQCIANYPEALVEYANLLPGFGILERLTLCLPDNNTNDCPTKPTVYGNVFYDYNKNGIKDEGENNFEGLEITFNPGEQVFTTDKEGYYYAVLSDTGTYTATISAPEYFDAIPESFDVSTNDYSDQIIQDLPLQANKEFNDLQVRIPYHTRARPGFNMIYAVEVLNHGSLQAQDIIIELDAPTFEIADTLSGFVVSNDKIYYTIDQLNVGEINKVYLYGKTALDALGEQVETEASISALDFSDDNTENNTDKVSFEVTGSFDPNDKQAIDSITVSHIEDRTPIEYLVRFQNTGTDTAFDVHILDTISNKLDLETFEVVSASHDYNAVWYADSVVVFAFENILLPDSTNDEPNSHGYIRYQLTPKTTVSEGDSIFNTAQIYFDFNDPVITNTVQTIVYNTPIEEETEEETEETNEEVTSEEDTESSDETTEEVTSIDLNKKEVLFYPNPVKGDKQIHVRTDGWVNVSISDYTGRTVYSKEMVDQTFYVNQLSPGFYILRYTTNDNVSGVVELIISE